MNKTLLCYISMPAILRRHNIHNHSQIPNSVNIQKVSPIEWVIMEETGETISLITS